MFGFLTSNQLTLNIFTLKSDNKRPNQMAEPALSEVTMVTCCTLSSILIMLCCQCRCEKKKQKTFDYFSSQFLLGMHEQSAHLIFL